MKFTRQARAGITIIEVMVVIAIILAVAAIAVPAVGSMMALEQRKTAKNLALTYELLHDQAVLRNVTFRVAYHIDANFYQIEVGRPDTLIFSTPEARQEHEEALADKLSRFTDEEKAELAQESAFSQLINRFNTKVELPRGTRFGGVYTPQYEDMVKPSGSDDPEDWTVVYSYIFPSGQAEHTVVHLVEADDEESGFSVEVAPLSGRVALLPELIDHRDRFSWVPDNAPELSE